jgi:hypothetical protein
VVLVCVNMYLFTWSLAPRTVLLWRWGWTCGQLAIAAVIEIPLCSSCILNYYCMGYGHAHRSVLTYVQYRYVYDAYIPVARTAGL